MARKVVRVTNNGRGQVECGHVALLAQCVTCKTLQALDEPRGALFWQRSRRRRRRRRAVQCICCRPWARHNSTSRRSQQRNGHPSNTGRPSTCRCRPARPGLARRGLTTREIRDNWPPVPRFARALRVRNVNQYPNETNARLARLCVFRFVPRVVECVASRQRLISAERNLFLRCRTIAIGLSLDDSLFVFFKRGFRGGIACVIRAAVGSLHRENAFGIRETCRRSAC